MKKLFASLCVLTLVSATSVYAVCNMQYYPGNFTANASQKVINKEKELTNKANNAITKQEQAKANAEKKQAAQKAALQKKQAEQKAKVQQKKDAINTLKSW